MGANGSRFKGVGSGQFGYTVAISDDGYTIAVTSINSITETVKFLKYDENNDSWDNPSTTPNAIESPYSDQKFWLYPSLNSDVLF